jgi:prepilin-type processing-associated H-X9-DG protein
MVARRKPSPASRKRRSIPPVLVRRHDEARPVPRHDRRTNVSYVDGFVIAVRTASKQAFVDHARKLDPVFIEHGALRVLECWGDDVPEGKLTDFRRAVQATAEETVVFSWIEWPDKATRDAGMAKVMADPRMSPENFAPVFDGKRMIFGGFAPVVDLAAQKRN